MKKYLFYISIIILTACDISKEDFVPSPAIEENTTAIFHTTSDAGLSINPTAFERLRDTKSFTISQLPKNGEVKFISNGFVHYKPNGNATTDNFTIEGQTAGGVKISENIQINIVASSNSLPCNAGCIGDYAKVEAEKSIEIDVTRNDKTCNQITSNSLKIEIPPKNGTVEIQNNRIVYKPNADFIGEDLFFYRIGISNTKNPVAPVEIAVTETDECTSGINDDAISLITYKLGSEIVIDVLQNDKICSLYQSSALKILKNPNIGTAKIVKINNKDVIVYSTNKALSTSETFEYALYRSENRFVKGKVSVAMN
jgi:Bacterial Ig domain